MVRTDSPRELPSTPMKHKDLSKLATRIAVSALLNALTRSPDIAILSVFPRSTMVLVRISLLRSLMSERPKEKNMSCGCTWTSHIPCLTTLSSVKQGAT